MSVVSLKEETLRRVKIETREKRLFDTTRPSKPRRIGDAEV
jgi:hypothetical protein